MQNVADLSQKTLDPQEAARRCGDGTACPDDAEKPRVRITHDDMKKRRQKARQKTR